MLKKMKPMDMPLHSALSMHYKKKESTCRVDSFSEEKNLFGNGHSPGKVYTIGSKRIEINTTIQRACIHLINMFA